MHLLPLHNLRYYNMVETSKDTIFLQKTKPFEKVKGLYLSIIGVGLLYEKSGSIFFLFILSELYTTFNELTDMAAAPIIGWRSPITAIGIATPL